MKPYTPPLWTCPVHGHAISEHVITINNRQYCRLCLQDYTRKQFEILVVKVCQEVKLIREAENDRN